MRFVVSTATSAGLKAMPLDDGRNMEKPEPAMPPSSAAQSSVRVEEMSTSWQASREMEAPPKSDGVGVHGPPGSEGGGGDEGVGGCSGTEPKTKDGEGARGEGAGEEEGDGAGGVLGLEGAPRLS